MREIRLADFIGFDLETHDDDAHEGIKRFRGNTPKAFDMRRTTVCGFSIYAKGSDRVYYVNLNHADVENRLTWDEAELIFEAKRPEASWICHNGPFEITVMRMCYGLELENVICSLQAAVSAYGPDQYSWETFVANGLGEMSRLMPNVAKAFATYNPEKEMSPKQGEVFAQIAGKASKASHSYNGHVYNISYGYGLKKAIKSFFNYRMDSFEETLKAADAKHMGELTGEQVLSYGCDDSYWAVRLFFEKLLPMMVSQNQILVNTFFDQENPMIYVYADIWCEGMRVNTEAIAERREYERAQAAKTFRELRQALAPFQFEIEPNKTLVNKETWYAKNHERYRGKICYWVNLGDQDTDYEEVMHTSGSVASGWFQGPGKFKGEGPNFTHYMTMRTVLYDLLQLKPLYAFGKVQSDGACRGELISILKDQIHEADPSEVEHLEQKIRVIELINQLAGIEQRMKLYLTPYSDLTDPETGRMYPTVSSKLATRRLAASNPNPMQLSKQGDSTYIRGFYQGDDDDHLVVSLDWSQIELVQIGEESGDPEFLAAYGQLPYNDLHRVAAADILSAEWDTEVTPEMFASLRDMPDDVDEPFGFPLKDATGKRLTPSGAYKWNRGTAGGKGANFGYWYSGALSSVASARGISSDKMWSMTEAYRNRFSVAEEWRVGIQAQAQRDGFITLPDGHRRVRRESTIPWLTTMRDWFKEWDNEAIKLFGNLFIKRMQSRSNNQAVNARIQGGCATLAKRAILRINGAIKERGLRARFMMPIHDELVFSCHKDDVVEFIKVARYHMTHHPDLFQKTVLHCTAAVGRTFEPWHADKAPYGQVELDEAPAASFIPPEKKNLELNEEEIAAVVRHMAEAA